MPERVIGWEGFHNARDLDGLGAARVLRPAGLSDGDVTALRARLLG